MSDDVRLIPPDERKTFTELPASYDRGAPRVWGPRLQELIGNPEWVELMQGRKSVLRATKSNFKIGKIKGPRGHIFECEVIQLEGQDDNEASLFFRWVGEDTPEYREEAARLKNLRMLEKIEKEINNKGAALNDGDSDAGVAVGEQREDPPVATAVGDPWGDREPDLPPGLEDFAETVDGPQDETPPYTGPGALSQPTPVVDEEVVDTVQSEIPVYESGLEDL